MYRAIRFGDELEHGGKVTAASSNMRVRGRYVARKGDDVTCSKHPNVASNKISEGDAKVTNRGVPVARHGHRALCGCRLLSSL